MQDILETTKRLYKAFTSIRAYWVILFVVTMLSPGIVELIAWFDRTEESFAAAGLIAAGKPDGVGILEAALNVWLWPQGYVVAGGILFWWLHKKHTEQGTTHPSAADTTA